MEEGGKGNTNLYPTEIIEQLEAFLDPAPKVRILAVSLSVNQGCYQDFYFIYYSQNFCLLLGYHLEKNSLLERFLLRGESNVVLKCNNKHKSILGAPKGTGYFTCGQSLKLMALAIFTKQILRP